MLYQYHHINPSVQVAIWKIEESEEDWIQEEWLSVQDMEYLNTITHPTKRLEFMAGRASIRALVQKLGMQYKGILKTAHGKPYLKDFTFEISLSHSFPFAAAIIHQNKDVGIDIEQPKTKLIRIAPKFLSSEEQEMIGDDLQKLVLAWCIKEALYKLHAQGDILFRKHMRLCPLDDQWDQIQVQLILDETHTFDVSHTKINDHYLCWLY